MRKPEPRTDEDGNVLTFGTHRITPPERWRGWEVGELVWAPSKNTRKLGAIRGFVLTTDERERALCFFDHDGERYEQFHDLDKLQKL